MVNEINIKKKLTKIKNDNFNNFSDNKKFDMKLCK